MKQIYHIAKCIQHYLSGQADEEEEKKVDDWLKENHNHEVIMNEFRQCDYHEKKSQEYNVFDKEKAYRRFMKAKRKIDNHKRIIRFISSAAAIAIIVGITIYARQTKDSPVNTPPRTSDIVTYGSNKALLVFENGQQINLTDSMQLELTELSIQLKVINNELICQDENCPPDSIPLAINKVITPRNGEYKLTLADGTRVWLNSDSEFHFPVRFTGSERKVYIKGEAYFEVAKDSLHPFVVETDKAMVKVLGTSFNIRAYTNEIDRTTLVEGVVEINSEGRRTLIKPNEQWIWNPEGGTTKWVNTKVALGWKNGDFAFEEQKLSNVFKELERWYDVDFSTIDPSVYELNFTGIFPRYENLDKVLNIIELAACVHFQINDRTIIVRKE